MSVANPHDPASASAACRSDFLLDGRRVSPSLNRVATPVGAIQVEPKIMRTLVCLAESAGEVVTRERLFREVWEGTYVTEDALTRAVGELRRIFEDDPARPRVIETIRKTGYRLLLAPKPVHDVVIDSRAARGPLHTRRARIAAAAVALLLVSVGVVAVRRALRASKGRGPTRVRALTALAGPTRDPAVSPDGTRVAFAWNGGASEIFSLYVQLVDGEAPVRITDQRGADDRLPAWSPDGRRLAFTRVTGDQCRLMIVSSLGGPARELRPCGDREYRRPAWSPDGRWIAFPRRDGSRPLEIAVVSPETLAVRAVTRPSAGILGDTSPAFSPDGRSIAFARNLTDGVSDVYRASLAGGDEKRLTFDHRDVIGLDWSADGESIVFSSSRAGIYSLWSVPSGGGEPVWVAGGGAKMKHPSTGRSRRVIAFENWVYAVNLWRVTLDRGSAAVPRRLTDAGDEWNFAPALSPGGDRLAFVSTRSGSEEVWTCDADGGHLRKLTSLGGARVETPRWSPDGRRLAFSARRDSRSDLYAIDATGSVAERLTWGDADALVPEWSADGTALYFTSRRDGSWQIWKLDLASRAVARVTSGGGYSAHPSPDGGSVYVSRPDAAGLWQVAGAGRRAESLPVPLAPEDWANWEVGRRGIYFRVLRAGAAEPVLAFWAFGAAGAVDVAPLSNQGWSGFAVSADGSSLVYPRVDRHECDIRLIEDVL